MNGAPDPTTVADNSRLTLIRGDLLIELQIIALLIDLVATYANYARDEEIDNTMRGVRAHTKAALEHTARLMRERADATIAGDATQEFRAARDSGRGRRG